MTSDPRVGFSHVTDVFAARHGPARLKRAERQREHSLCSCLREIKTGLVCPPEAHHARTDILYDTRSDRDSFNRTRYSAILNMQ